MFRWSVRSEIELGIVRFILFENVVNGSEQHSGDSNNCLLVTSALFNRKVTVADFRVVLFAYSAKSALNKQWLDISPCTTDTGCFLLSGT